MLRRTLTLLLATTIAGGIPVAFANHDVPVAPDLFPRVADIVNPLSGMPAIHADGETLRVELAPERVGTVTAPRAALRPSFGAAIVDTPLTLLPDATAGIEDSELWPARTVLAFDFAIPALGGVFIPDLYDLVVEWDAAGETHTDVQHRAVSIVDEHPTNPRFVILADPSVGDPRPIQEGAEDLQRNDTASLIDKTTKTVGNPMNEDRWAALNRAIDEINVLRPDFVLVAGDLTFAAYPRAINWEYEDAHRILARLQVPTFLSPGNHDLYHLEYDNLDRPWLSDGWELWQMYFGPLYYARSLTPDIRLVSLNTFDWPQAQREPFDEDDEFSTRAGGQIQPEQFAWMDAQLGAAREDNPNGQIITLAHHDPSWIQARHPWPGINRLEARDLLATRGVGAHFAGHSHEDRVARYHLGDVVETNGRKGPKNVLQRILRTNVIDSGRTQEELGAIIRDPAHGPVFVTTTTVSSVLKGSDWGLGSYWGYRFGQLRARPGGGYDPLDFGYPATRAFLEARAERPEFYNAEHAQYGVYSYPSYELDVTRPASPLAAASTTAATVTSRLLADVDLTLRFSATVTPSSTITAVGGTIVSERRVGTSADVYVRVSVPAGARVDVSIHLTEPA